MEIVVGAVIVAVALLLAARALITTITVREYQRALKFANGKFARLLGPGRHWLWRPSHAVQLVDIRETILPVAGQEVVTADGVSVKLSLTVRYRLDDPVVAITKIDNYWTATYALLQVGLREVVAALSIDDLLQSRDTIGRAVHDRCAEAVRQLGVELVTVDLKDLMFPGPLKKLFAQVTEARQQGLAALEKARGETAALRSLANAARLIDANPSLLHLRTLQQLANSPGNTLIVGMPQSSTPLPVTRQASEPQLPGPEEPGASGE